MYDRNCQRLRTQKLILRLANYCDGQHATRKSRETTFSFLLGNLVFSFDFIEFASFSFCS